jgi:hypothetical protein
MRSSTITHCCSSYTRRTEQQLLNWENKRFLFLHVSLRDSLCSPHCCVTCYMRLFNALSNKDFCLASLGTRREATGAGHHFSVLSLSFSEKNKNKRHQVNKAREREPSQSVLVLLFLCPVVVVHESFF